MQRTMNEQNEIRNREMKERDELNDKRTRKLEKLLADSERTKPGDDEEIETRANFRSKLKSGASRRLSFADDVSGGASGGESIRLSHFHRDGSDEDD